MYQAGERRTHTTFTFRVRSLSMLRWCIVSKSIMYRLMEVSVPFGLYDPLRVACQSQMNETCRAAGVHCPRMESESSCGIAHHMSLLKLTWISHFDCGPVETVSPAGTARLVCSVAEPVGPGGSAGTARLESMSTSGCSVADLVSSAPAMVLRRRLGEASPRTASPTKQFEQRAIIQGRQS